MRKDVKQKLSSMLFKKDKSSWHSFAKDLAVNNFFPSWFNATSYAIRVRISLSIFKKHRLTGIL